MRRIAAKPLLLFFFCTALAAVGMQSQGLLCRRRLGSHVPGSESRIKMGNDLYLLRLGPPNASKPQTFEAKIFVRARPHLCRCPDVEASPVTHLRVWLHGRALPVLPGWLSSPGSSQTGKSPALTGARVLSWDHPRTAGRVQIQPLARAHVESAPGQPQHGAGRLVFDVAERKALRIPLGSLLCSSRGESGRSAAAASSSRRVLWCTAPSMRRRTLDEAQGRGQPA